MLYEVLDHVNTHDDITAFFALSKTAVSKREFTLQDISAKLSSHHPSPLRTVLA